MTHERYTMFLIIVDKVLNNVGIKSLFTTVFVFPEKVKETMWGFPINTVIALWKSVWDISIAISLLL